MSPVGFSKRVRNYYTSQGMREWNRLIKDPYHQVEFITTMYFLRKNLPKHGHILDAGGGPGRYTVELAKLGYDVTLLDLTPKLLSIAKRQIKKEGVEGKIKRISEGSITDLSEFRSGSFDAVLCLGGPLSHLTSEKYRKRAASELIRVAKRNAPLFISVISRLGVLIFELKNYQNEIKTPIFRRIRNSGDISGVTGFTAAHFFLSEELKELFEAKTQKIQLVSLEGLGAGHDAAINRLHKNKKNWRAWIKTHLETCTDPDILGVAEHLLLIGKKK